MVNANRGSKSIFQSASLTVQEKAYIMDKLSGSSYYVEQFGDLDEKTERRLIFSIFFKMNSF